MLKKRILASTMASVMALSSVSVVAFAEDVETPKTEAVTRKQLEEYLKSLEDFVEKDLDDYGTTMSEYFEDAYNAADVVVNDKDATADDVTAAYQMLKAVKNSLRIYTSEELKDLVDDNQRIRDTENELNEEFGDEIYTETTWDEFESAFDTAADCLEETDSKIINDAYADLDAAVKGLTEKDSVTKSAFRSTYNKYIDLVDEMEDYEDWRRGKATVGGNKLSFKDDSSPAKEYKDKSFKGEIITFGELKKIVKGSSDELPVSMKEDLTKTYTEADLTDDAGNDNWITFGGYGSASDLRDDIENAYQKFVTEKSSNKTTMTEIVKSYEAMETAIEIFKGWEVDSVKRGSKSAIDNLIDDYHDQIVSKLLEENSTAFDAMIIALDNQLSAAGTPVTDIGDITELSKADNKVKVLANAGVPANTTINLDPETGWLLLDDSGEYVATAGASTKTVKVQDGDDLTEYMPLDEDIISTTLDKFCKSGTGLVLSDGMSAFVDCKTQDELDSGRRYDTAVGTTIDSRKTLNENSTKSAAYPLVYRVIKYALDDIFPSEDEYTKRDVAQLVSDSRNLIEKTGDAAKFAAKNSTLDQYSKAAKEWVAKANGTKGYKDGDEVTYNDGRYDIASTICSGKNATAVYKALEKKYDDLEKALKKYPISYGDIAETIVEVAEGIDGNSYGAKADEIKALAETVAYELSTLKEPAKDDCEVFDDDRNFIFYNRLNVDDSPSEGEKALKKNYDALLKAMEEATAAPATVGDVDADGVVGLLDVKLLVDAYAGNATLTADQITAGDVDGDGDADLADAKAILNEYLKG